MGPHVFFYWSLCRLWLSILVLYLGFGMMCGGSWWEMRDVDDLLGFGVPRACLPELGYPSAIFRLWPLYTDPVCAITLDPRMHRYVACTNVMAILLLMYTHVLE